MPIDHSDETPEQKAWRQERNRRKRRRREPPRNSVTRSRKGSPQTPSRCFGSARAKKLRRYARVVMNPRARGQDSIYGALRSQWRSSTTAERGKFAKRMKRQMVLARARQEAERPQ